MKEGINASPEVQLHVLCPGQHYLPVATVVKCNYVDLFKFCSGLLFIPLHTYHSLFWSPAINPGQCKSLVTDSDY